VLLMSSVIDGGIANADLRSLDRLHINKVAK